MFKRAIACVALAVFLSVNTGCFGSFTATKKLYNWNSTLGDKWVKSIVMVAFMIIPIYEICAFVDVIALNLIEFWAGSNPMALNSDTEMHKTVESKGKVYHVTMGKGMITIVETKGPDAGKMVRLTYKKDKAAWFLSDGAGSRMVASFDPKPLNNAHLYYPDGSVVSKNMNAPELAATMR